MKNTVAKIGENLTSPILIIFFTNILEFIFTNELRFHEFIDEKNY